MLTIGKISYINVLPLWGGIMLNKVPFPKNMHWIEDVPTALNRSLNEEKCDIAFVSCVEYLQHKERYDLFPGFCVAAYEKVLSVNLYYKENLYLADLDQKKIALTPQSATSTLLLKTLCKHYWGIVPQWVELSDIKQYSQYDAFLLIGNEAIQAQTLSGYKTLDLAQAWHYATGLPFCFAVCAMQKGLGTKKAQEVAALQECLKNSLAWGKQNREQIVELAQEQLNHSSLSIDLLQCYFNHLHFELDADVIKGLNKFESLL
ncbi:MAG: hypothetical protein K0S74_1330 [Chlamydiales bacterium]|jgi:chorismate dehydratase|nr:hypothetical protein [Chlamydiales bacterium]